MILTNILHKLAPLAVAMSIACAPVQVKQTSIEKPAVTHEEPNVTYIAKQAPV